MTPRETVGLYSYLIQREDELDEMLRYILLRMERSIGKGASIEEMEALRVERSKKAIGDTK